MTEQDGPRGDWSAPDGQPAQPGPSGPPPYVPSHDMPTPPQAPHGAWAQPEGAPAPASAAWGEPPLPPGAYQDTQPEWSAPAAPSPTNPGTQAAAPITFRSWQPGILALRPLPFGDFITVPFRAMRYARGAAVGAPMLLTLASILITSLALVASLRDGSLAGVFSPNRADLVWPQPETIGLAVIAVVVWILVDTVASSVMVPTIAQAALGKKLTVAEALRATLSRLWALLGLGLIGVVFGVVVYGIALLPLIADVRSNSSSGAGIGFSVLLMFVLGIPAIVVAGIFSMVARGAIMLERKGPFGALRRAFTLVPGRFWWTVLLLIVIGLINGAVQQVFGFVSQIAAIILAAAAPDQATGFAIAFIVGFAVQTLVGSVAQYSFMGGATALVYLDMRFRKEGLAFAMAQAAEDAHRAGPTGTFPVAR